MTRLCWLLVFIAAGCASDEASVTGSAGLPCESDADCAPGGVCAFGVCQPSLGAPAPVDLEVRPPSRSALLPTRFPRAELPASGPWALRLAEPVVYETVVLDGDGEPISAELLFEPQVASGGRPLDLGFRVSRDRPARLRLTPGRYDVSMSPLEPGRPAHEVSDFEVEPGPGPRKKELVFPRAYRVLSGRVRARYSSASTIEGVTVQAVGMESGLASTRDVSDPEGRYRLLLPESRDTTFVLRAVPPSELQPTWNFEQVVRVPAGESREKTIDLSVASDAVRGAITLEVIGLGLDGPVPVADARVTLAARSGPDTSSRSFRVTGRTASDGRARVDDDAVIPVLRGRYRAVVEPPLDAPFARLETTLDLGTVGNNVTEDRQLTLEPRTRVRGQVRDVSGAPVPFARVAFEALDAPARRAPDATSGADGRFEVALDPGAYILLAQPRRAGETAPLARAVARLEVPSQAAFDVPPVVAPPGRVVRGSLRAARGAPVVDAEITAFAARDGVRLVADRATTDASGAFTLVLPR